MLILVSLVHMRQKNEHTNSAKIPKQDIENEQNWAHGMHLAIPSMTKKKKQEVITIKSQNSKSVTTNQMTEANMAIPFAEAPNS